MGRSNKLVSNICTNKFERVCTLNKSLLIVKLRFFQNASIEIKQIFFTYQKNRFAVKKLICKIRNENSFTDKRFLLTLKINPLNIKELNL